MFLKGPCEFETRSKHQHPTAIDLRKLDLNALETVTETKGNKYNGRATSIDEIISVYQLLLRDGESKGHAEFGDIDSATRTAKAFSALAKRCGAKLDERFK